VKAAAMALIAGIVCSVGGSRQARCFSEKRARKRRARKLDSCVRVLRSSETTESPAAVPLISGPVAEGAILEMVHKIAFSICRCLRVVVKIMDTRQKFWWGKWSVLYSVTKVYTVPTVPPPRHRHTVRATTVLRCSSSDTPQNMGSVVLPHLVTGWHVDQAIMSEEERLVVIRFGRDWDPDCMRQDEVLYRQ